MLVDNWKIFFYKKARMIDKMVLSIVFKNSFSFFFLLFSKNNLAKKIEIKNKK